MVRPDPKDVDAGSYREAVQSTGYKPPRPLQVGVEDPITYMVARTDRV